MIDFCAETCSTAQACMLLDQHEMFLQCIVDLDLPTAAKSDLVLTFAFLVIKVRSNINGNAELKSAEKVFCDESVATRVSEKASVRYVPSGPHGTWVLPSQTMHFISALLETTPYTRRAPASLRTFARCCSRAGCIQQIRTLAGRRRVSTGQATVHHQTTEIALLVCLNFTERGVEGL